MKVSLIVLIVYAAIYGTVFSLRIVLAVDSPIVLVEGTSMIPNLREGDMLVVRGVANKSQIEIKDIIIFHSPYPNRYNELIVHRVIDHFTTNGKLYFQTKGDNNSSPDPVISEDNVVAVVMWKIPVPILGSVLIFTQSAVGRLVLVICILLIIIDMFYSRDGHSSIKEKKS